MSGMLLGYVLILIISQKYGAEGVGVYNLTAVGWGDIFIQKMNSSGNFLWARSMGGMKSDIANSMSIDNNDNIYITGTLDSLADFDPGVGVLNLTSVNGDDVFIQKFSQCIATPVTDTIIACDSLVWIDGNIYTANNNIALYTMSSVNSCDSIINLNLTIINSTSSIDIIHTCNNYTWTNGITYTSSNNSATDTLVNSAGCDSIITLNLTIDTVNTTLITNVSSITSNAINETYQWLNCNNNYSIIAGANSQSYSATSNGNYAVEVTQNTCVDTSICVNIANIGLQEMNSLNQIFIYPNPTNGVISIRFGNVQNVKLEVYSTLGQKIYFQDNINDSDYKFLLNEPKGIYYIRLSNEDGIKRYRIVLE